MTNRTNDVRSKGKQLTTSKKTSYTPCIQRCNNLKTDKSVSVYVDILYCNAVTGVLTIDALKTTTFPAFHLHIMFSDI